MAKVVDITNAVRTQSFLQRLGALLGFSHNDERDIYDIFGYPQSLGGDEGFRLMLGYSKRQGIANRIVFGVPRICWRDGFNVLSDPDDESSTELEDELRALNERGLAAAIERADVLNRAGRFSLLMVGVPDGQTPDKPVGRVAGGVDALANVYFKPIAYDCVRIKTRETDPTSPRYGLPVLYTITGTQQRDDAKTSPTLDSFDLHYSRVVHFNENELDDPIEGTSALEPVFNRILDQNRDPDTQCQCVLFVRIPDTRDPRQDWALAGQ